MAGLHRNSDGVFDLYIDEVAKTADYTILPTDAGKLFTNSGAVGTVIFTLPLLFSGANYRFAFLTIADFTITIQGETVTDHDKIVTSNDVAADSISFSTGGDKIGSYVEVFSNLLGTKWYLRKFSPNAMTIAS